MASIVVSDLEPASAQTSATSVISETASSTSSRRTRAHRSNLSVLIDELNREVRSNSEESVTETRTTSGAEPQTSNWTKIVNVLKAMGTVCSVTCPPMPNRIVRKVAFHPPPKNSGYRLQLDSEQHRFTESAKEVVGKPFKLVPTPMRGLTHHDYAWIMERITATTIKSPHGNDLVVIKVRSRLPPASESMRKQIVLMTQPNSSDLGHFLQPHCINFVQVADSIGLDMYAFDYSGFGYSTGYPSERHIYADTLAVFEHVNKENPDLSIVLLGYSIGTAAAVDVAYRKTLAVQHTNPPPLSGMILVAPFTSAIRLLSSQPTKESTCCFDPFSNSSKISNIDLPILIIHGTDDSMVPLEHGTALAQRLRQPLAPFIVQGADHQTVFGVNPSTFPRMSSFVRNETLVGKSCVDSQPAVRSVIETRTEKSVPVVSRCPSVESLAQPTPIIAPATPVPPKATPVPVARSSKAATPLKTAQESLRKIQRKSFRSGQNPAARHCFTSCHPAQDC
ncbi:hypothetical protein PRIPAC_74362 [Pristionchus pacificus]|nr:hypothetical protein PRIPAC_74362 [Pristionchus pacificus]